VLALALEAADDLLVALLSFAVQRFGPGARVLLDLADLLRAFGIDCLRPLASLRQQLVRLHLGVGDQLVGGFLSQGEDLGCCLDRCRTGRCGGRHWRCRLWGRWRRRGRGSLRRTLRRCRGHRGGDQASTARHRGQLLPKLVVLPVHPGQFGLDLVQELVDLLHVVTLTQADGRELLVLDVLGTQRHSFTSGLSADKWSPYPVIGTTPQPRAQSGQG
jgi:hypothetical protein